MCYRNGRRNPLAVQDCRLPFPTQSPAEEAPSRSLSHLDGRQARRGSMIAARVSNASNDEIVSFPRGERTEAVPQRTPRVGRSLGRRFGYLWATFAVSSLGDGLGYGAVPLLALFVNPHPLPVASVAAADTFPWLVLALPAGALADRFERGRLMAVTNFGRALVLVTLALLVASGHINLPLLILLVFVNGGRGPSTTPPPRRRWQSWSNHARSLKRTGS